MATYWSIQITWSEHRPLIGHPGSRDPDNGCGNFWWIESGDQESIDSQAGQDNNRMSPASDNQPLWATEPYRVVKLKKKKICRFFCINHYIYIWVGDIRPKLVGSSLFRASTTPKTGQNCPFWPVLATLACLTPGRPFFWLDISGYHLWTFTLGCGEVISGPISLDPGL